MTTEELLEFVGAGLTSYDLARPYIVGMPQSPAHPPYWHTLPRRHGDHVRSDGSSAANDLITMGTHVGTHMDALAHGSHDGRLHGGLDAAQEQIGGRFGARGIDETPPQLTRGTLLDVPAALGIEACPPGYEITPDDLDAACEQQGTAARPGDAVFIRTGWGQRWADGAPYVGTDSGAPGIGESGARWLAERRPTVVGADTLDFDCMPGGHGPLVLPAHRVLLVEAGINIIETMNLEEIARDGVYEFLCVIIPLNLAGATGSPVRPLALVAPDR